MGLGKLLGGLSGALGLGGGAAAGGLMAALGPASLAIGAVGSIGQMISGASRANKAKKALESFQRQELRNVTEGMRVSTLGAELQTQEAQRRFATTVDALQSGGVRGLVGGLGVAEQAQQQQQQQISADLDRQQQQIETMRANDEAAMRGIREQRDMQQIQGMGAELSAARQQQAAGATNLLQTGLAAYQMGQPANNMMSDSSLKDFLGGSGSTISNRLGMRDFSKFDLGAGSLDYSGSFMRNNIKNPGQQ